MFEKEELKENIGNMKSKIKTALCYVGLLSVLVMVAVFGFTLFGPKINITRDNEVNTQQVTSILNAKLEQIGELNTASYTSEVLIKRKKFAVSNWDLPLNRKQLVVSYTGNVKAGFKDLSLAKVSSEGNGVFVVSVPQPVITNVSIDQSKTSVYVDEDYVFNRNNIEDWRELEIEAKKDIVKRAEDANIYELAKTNAQTTVGRLLEETLVIAGVKNGKVIVNFKA